MKPNPVDSLIVERPFLDNERPFGISGILRLKNAESFLEQVVDAFIPYLDELVAVYADCDDATPEILQQLLVRYPTKLRIFKYPSSVASIRTREHHMVGRFSPESIANYYNWGFQKASYSIVTKIDHDHLPMGTAFADAVEMIRRTKPRHFLYTYSGLNICRNKRGELGVPVHHIFCGIGDHWFVDVGDDLYFEHLPRYENLVFDRKRSRKHLGLCYWHLKTLLPEFVQAYPDFEEELMAWEEFVALSKRRFSFWGYKCKGRYRRALEGRNHLLAAILSRLPILRKVRRNRIYINVMGLRGLSALPGGLPK